MTSPKRFLPLASALLFATPTMAEKAEPFGQESVETRPLRNKKAAGAAKPGGHAHAKGHSHHHGTGKPHIHEQRHKHAHATEANHAHGPMDDHGVETGHIFGFLMGSDTHPKGQVVLEAETLARFGRANDYAAINKKMSLNYALTNDLTVAGGILLAYYNILDPAPAPPAREQGARFDGFGFELRWRLLNRKENPFGVTLLFEPAYALSDDQTGRSATKYGSENRLIIDRELVHNKLFGTLNLNYDIDTGRDFTAANWSYGSRIASGFGLSYQVFDKVFIGSELRYMRAHDGLGLNSYRGDALYLGPTFYTEYKNVWASLAFAAQIAGSDPALLGSNINLTQFERYQMRFRLGYEF